MVNILEEQISTEIELQFVDPHRLAWRLGRHAEDLEIKASYAPQRVTLWDEFKTGYRHDDRIIKAKGRYDLTQALYRWPLQDKDIVFGTIFIEKGLLKEGDCDCEGDYERVVLQTRREFVLKNGAIVPPTRIEIVVEGAPEYYSVHYSVKREDRHPNLVEAVKTRWFLTAYLRNVLKEQEAQSSIVK